MKKLFRFVVLGIVASSFALTGCGLDQHPAYSPGIKYGVRQDPLITGQAAKLGDDRYDPDRPGVLPVMHFQQIFESEHPYHLKIRETLAGTLDGLIDGQGKKAASMAPAERFALQNKLLLDPKHRTVYQGAIDALIRDPMSISAAERQEMEKALEDQFGTPAKPTINAAAAGIDEDTIKKLQLDDDTLAEGSKRYRVHCLHCHGVPGDGRGPTARWINPHPRDFRAGMFKFQSVDQASDGRQRPPSRADLLRTLRHGIEGTAMPSFNLLADHELEKLVSYVMHLSIRGRAESEIIKTYFDFDAKKGGLVWNGGPGDEPMNKAEAAAFFTKKLVVDVGGWKDGNDPARAIKVEPYPYKDGDMAAFAESVQRGKQLFLGDEKHPRGKNANCKQCHDDYGRQARFKLDDWGTLARPNNFALGVFRGGKRPVDIYYRVHSGINGSGMTNFGRAGVLEPNDIWDLVNFVTTLPYPAMREKLGVNID